MSELHQFFISCPLNFEEVLLTEIQEISPYLLDETGQSATNLFLQPEVTQGGVLLEAPLMQGLQLNFFLKTANRVLLRFGHFKAYEFQVLESKFLQLKKLNLIKDSVVRFQVSAEKSKLNNESRIADCLEKLMARIQKKSLNPTASSLTVYVRVSEDQFTFSIDTTGEHLHKRGFSSLKGEAPLRETTAALLLKLMMAAESPATLKQITLIDPMMGAGTFLTEGITSWWPVFSRPYDFQNWKWVPSILKLPLLGKNYQSLPSYPFKEYLGGDISEKALKNAQGNFQQLQKAIADTLKVPEAPQVPSFMANVLSELPGNVVPPVKSWILVNPPYGERLDDKEGVLSENLLPHLISTWKPQKIGLLLPQRSVAAVQRGSRLKPQIWRINNGGLETQFLLYSF